MAVVVTEPDASLLCVDEARPSVVGVVLRLGVEQLLTAPGAPLHPGLVDVQQVRREARFSSALAEDAILLGG